MHIVELSLVYTSSEYALGYALWQSATSKGVFTLGWKLVMLDGRDAF